MAETTKPIEVTPWLDLIERCNGGIKCGELTIFYTKAGTGKSRLTEYLAEQERQKAENGIR